MECTAEITAKRLSGGRASFFDKTGLTLPGFSIFDQSVQFVIYKKS